MVEPKDLEKLHKDYEEGLVSNKKVYICQMASKDLVVHKDGKAFDKADYYKNPNDYESNFYTYLNFVNWLVNGVYWEAKYPRVLSIDELRDAKEEKRSKLQGVCDISADYEGSLEFTKRFTSIENPFLLYDVIKSDFLESIGEMNENSILYHSVDHLPAEMPKEASNHFGEKLLPFVKACLEADYTVPFEDLVLPNECKNAMITYNGRLTPKFEYIMQMREQTEKASKA